MKRVSLAVALALVAGCATLPPPASRPPAEPPPGEPRSARTPPATPTPVAGPATGAPGTQVGSTASGGTIRLNDAPLDTVATPPVVADSLPSRDALAVLATIPEPLGRSSDRTPPRTAPPSAAPGNAAGTGASPPAGPGATAPRDTAGTTSPGGAAADTSAADTAAVPVPEPTRPLGDRPGAGITLPDSLAALPSTASAPVSPPTSAPAAPPAVSATSPDSCWRVQVAAKPERLRSERLRAAAESQLSSSWVIEHEGGLYKVRTRDCLTAAAAEDLKRRAVAAGFDGAFKLRKKP